MTKTRGLNAGELKIIAVIAMVIDHIAFGFVPDYTLLYFIMRLIGKITCPIMCYFVAEGYFHTRNVYKYMSRLGLFAVISHLPYVWYFKVSMITSSVMLPLFSGLVALWAYDSGKIKKPLNYLVILLCFILSITSDWSCMPVLWIFVLGKFHDDKKMQFSSFAIVCGIFAVATAVYDYTQAFMVGIFLALILLRFYNGERGIKSPVMKWGFYVFYPLHLIILLIIRTLI